ncbi:MAG: ABC transporter permease subunit, partial [Halobacteriovoraceae bacterium]|nr:ABC transporter permease subunit [Halobacteriovoraceae bacterium]
RRMSPKLDLAARSLGQNHWTIFKKIHLPLVRKSVLIAFLLVFMELLKEMPITLLIRPFNWDTLAIKIFEFTSEGEWERASVPAILLVIPSILTIFIMNKREESENSHIGT